MKIESFEISDYEKAVIFWKEIKGITLNESDSKEAITSFLGRNSGLSFIAKNLSNEIVGTILCGHDGRAGQIYHLAVSSTFRGKGIGKKLVDLCFSRLALESIPRCNIFVYSDNSIGKDFWVNSGWDDPTTWKVLQRHIKL